MFNIKKDCYKKTDTSRGKFLLKDALYYFVKINSIKKKRFLFTNRDLHFAISAITALWYTRCNYCYYKSDFGECIQLKKIFFKFIHLKKVRT